MHESVSVFLYHLMPWGKQLQFMMPNVQQFMMLMKESGRVAADSSFNQHLHIQVHHYQTN
jgi:hypothetical protein